MPYLYVQPIFTAYEHSPLALEVPEFQVVHAYICKTLFLLSGQSLRTLHTAREKGERMVLELKKNISNRGIENLPNGS